MDTWDENESLVKAHAPMQLK